MIAASHPGIYGPSLRAWRLKWGTSRVEAIVLSQFPPKGGSRPPPSIRPQIRISIFIDGSRGPLSAVGGRPVHVINAVLPICAQNSGHQPLFEPVAATVRLGSRDA